MAVRNISNIHLKVFALENLGWQISDAVTTLGANVDGSVRRIDTAYNNQGLAYLFTSYADTAGTQIVNQVENIYNGLGQITEQYQAVNGAVDTATTPVVQYTYSDPSTGSIPMSVVYPNGRSIYFGYEAGIDGAIGRLSLIMDGANSGDTNQVLEQYSYLGLSTIVGISRPQTGIDMSLLGATGSVGAGGDQYTGLDQFGRITSQQWANSTGTVLDAYTYTYDQNSNVTSKTNVLNSAYSETYTNDNLNRLTSVTRGGAAYQSWNLDSQGNWSSSTTSGTTQTRTTNNQNQITSITGTAGTPQYDSNGNMIVDQNGNTLKYDAWNRLVLVTNSSGQLIAAYSYNALSQRVTETYPQGIQGFPVGTVKNLYYSTSGQVLEERFNGTSSADTEYQYVWSAAYANAMVLRDWVINGVVQAGNRKYTVWDANYNVTALIGHVNNDASQPWAVVQRYVYAPYGSAITLDGNWNTITAQFSWQYMYQGGRFDAATGLYHFGARNYSPSLGVWTSQDPAQYINGADTYQFVGDLPTLHIDPLGLAIVNVGTVYQLVDANGNILYIGSTETPGTRFYSHPTVQRAVNSQGGGTRMITRQVTADDDGIHPGETPAQWARRTLRQAEQNTMEKFKPRYDEDDPDEFGKPAGLNKINAVSGENYNARLREYDYKQGDDRTFDLRPTTDGSPSLQQQINQQLARPPENNGPSADLADSASPKMPYSITPAEDGLNAELQASAGVGPDLGNGIVSLPDGGGAELPSSDVNLGSAADAVIDAEAAAEDTAGGAALGE